MESRRRQRRCRRLRAKSIPNLALQRCYYYFMRTISRKFISRLPLSVDRVIIYVMREIAQFVTGE